MARIIYTVLCSLDGYIEDSSGSFDWAVPDPAVHQFVNEQERSIGTHLYGRRLYETMRVWETLGETADSDEERQYAAIWRGLDKVVYSASLPAVDTTNTRLERKFDPAAIRVLKVEAVADFGIGGAALAATAIRAGLVDELRMFVNPISVGGGKPALPPDLKWRLRLHDQHVFDSGVVYLCYQPQAG